MSHPPLVLYRDVVRPEWVDYNHHLNVAFYVRAFDFATDAFFDHAGVYLDYIERTGCTLYVREMHVSYHREMKEGAPMRFETRVLDADEKRLHLFHSLYHDTDDYLAATNEIMCMHVDTATRRSAPFAPDRRDALAAIARAHAALPAPPDKGSVIGIRRHPRARDVA